MGIDRGRIEEEGPVAARPRGLPAEDAAAGVTLGAGQVPFRGRPSGLATPPRPGRGLAASRTALLLGMQQTLGNRAMQRYLQRTSAAAVTPRAPANEQEPLDERIRAAGSGQPLEPAVQHTLEGTLGADLSRVRIHNDAEADRLSRAVDAQAFTTGSQVFFRSGMYDPSSPGGMRLLAHEATHVLQQAAGPVAGTPAVGGVSVSDPQDRFEQAAERQASQATMSPTASQRDASRVAVQPRRNAIVGGRNGAACLCQVDRRWEHVPPVATASRPAGSLQRMADESIDRADGDNPEPAEEDEIGPAEARQALIAAVGEEAVRLIEEGNLPFGEDESAEQEADEVARHVPNGGATPAIARRVEEVSLQRSPVAAVAVAAGIGSAILCAYGFYVYALDHYGRKGDKWMHCWTSCKIQTYCPGATAAIVGAGKEVVDAIGDQLGYPMKGEWADLVADFEGIACAPSFQSCISCCDKAISP